jgi:hypothetical protein
VALHQDSFHLKGLPSPAWIVVLALRQTRPMKAAKADQDGSSE